MMRLNLNCLLPLAVGVFAVSLHAQVTYVQTNGTSYQTPALTGFTTTGNEMAGMGVSVNFSDGTTQTATWAATGADSGAASAANYFTIGESGDTFASNAWTLENLSSTLSITGFSLFGVPGNTTFDRVFGGLEGTPGSGSGLDFNIVGAAGLGVTATYSDILNLTGSPAVGDEFVLLSVGFANPFAPDAIATFSQDTDSARTSSSIVATAPDEASTLLLVGAAFSVFAGLRRKR